MSTLARQSPLISPRRQYITTGAFNANFKSYTVTTLANGEQTGAFSAVTGATADNCPKGRILHENGKSLIPNRFNSAALNVNDYWVGVYDPASGLKGFIKPNDTVFATLNTNKPGWINAFEQSDSDIDTSLVGTSTAVNGNITIPRSSGTGLANTDINRHTTAAGSITYASGATIQVYNSLVISTSIIIVTPIAATAAGDAALAVTTVGTGTFTVTGAAKNFNYLIIN